MGKTDDNKEKGLYPKTQDHRIPKPAPDCGHDNRAGRRGDRVRVEIQIRTVAMDAWARLDHELRYKKGLRDVDHIYHDLQKCADTVASVDNEMHRIREKIRNAQTC